MLHWAFGHSQNELFAERAFSVAGLFATKTHSSLSNKSGNAPSFQRIYYKNKWIKQA